MGGGNVDGGNMDRGKWMKGEFGWMEVDRGNVMDEVWFGQRESDAQRKNLLPALSQSRDV